MPWWGTTKAQSEDEYYKTIKLAEHLNFQLNYYYTFLHFFEAADLLNCTRVCKNEIVNSEEFWQSLCILDFSLFEWFLLISPEINTLQIKKQTSHKKKHPSEQLSLLFITMTGREKWAWLEKQLVWHEMVLCQEISMLTTAQEELQALNHTTYNHKAQSDCSQRWRREQAKIWSTVLHYASGKAELYWLIFWNLVIYKVQIVLSLGSKTTLTCSN